MSSHSAQKQGKKSGAQKAASTRRLFEPASSTSPTPGASGREAEPATPDGLIRKIAREAERRIKR
jgi:hypothetical protein